MSKSLKRILFAIAGLVGLLIVVAAIIIFFVLLLYITASLAKNEE